MVPFTNVLCLRSVRYDLNYFRVAKSNNSCSFCNKIWWSTVSKAFFRSRKSTPFTRPLSILRYQSLVASNRAVSVECVTLMHDDDGDDDDDDGDGDDDDGDDDVVDDDDVDDDG